MASAKRAVELMIEEPKRVTKLQENVCWFCQCLNENGVSVTSDTAITPIKIGAEDKALKVSKYLMEQGYYKAAMSGIYASKKDSYQRDYL